MFLKKIYEAKIGVLKISGVENFVFNVDFLMNVFNICFSNKIEFIQFISIFANKWSKST